MQQSNSKAPRTDPTWPRWPLATKILVVLLLISGLAWPGAYVLGQSAGWSAPTALGYGWFPDVATDASGQVHVAWAAGLNNYDVVLYTHSVDGRKWSQPNDVEARPSLGAVTRPTLLVDDQSILHMTFKDYTAFYTHGPAGSISASTLLPPAMVSKGQGAYFTQMAYGPKGVLHLIYTENVPSTSCPVCFHVYYRQSVDTGLNWSPAVDLTATMQSGSAKPQIVVDPKGNIHVVWESGRGGDLGQLLSKTATVMYAASYDGGKSWTAPREFTPPDNSTGNIATLDIQGGRDVTIGLDGKGRLVAAWLYLPEDVIYYQVSGDDGQSWSQTQVIEGVWGRSGIQYSALDDYAMATDSAGNLHLVLVGRTNNDKNLLDAQKALQLIHLVWNSTSASWSAPEVIANYPVFGRLNGVLAGDYPEWPRLSIANGNQLHAVWFVRDAQNLFGDTSAYRIWYAQETLSAPAIPPVALPTLPPQVNLPTSVSPTTPAVVQATPVPTFASQPTASSPSASSESNILVILAKAIAPTIGILVLLTGGILLWRRLRN